MARRRRYIGEKKTRLRHERRSIPQEGDNDDDGRYYNCWHCGATCDIQTTSLGGKRAKHGSNPVISDGLEDSDRLQYTRPEIGDAKTQMLINAGIGNRFVIMELGSDGTAKTIAHEYRASGVGCPLCFTRTWKK